MRNCTFYTAPVCAEKPAHPLGAANLALTFKADCANFWYSHCSLIHALAHVGLYVTEGRRIRMSARSLVIYKRL